MSASRPALLHALLSSIAVDLEQVQCADLTRDAVGRAWLAGRSAPSGRDRAALVLCELDELARGLEAAATGALLLARTHRDDRRAQQLADSFGLVLSASVRDGSDQWHLLVRLARPDRDTHEFDATLVLDVRDQARELLRVLTVLATDDGPFRWECVVVDRGSRDETRHVLAAATGDLTVVEIDAGVGRDAAVELGFQLARAPLLVRLDVAWVPAQNFLHAVVDAASWQGHLDAFTGPRLGPSARGYADPGRTVEIARATPELFAVRARRWLEGQAEGETRAPLSRRLAGLGRAGYVPMFSARSIDR